MMNKDFAFASHLRDIHCLVAADLTSTTCWVVFSSIIVVVVFVVVVFVVVVVVPNSRCKQEMQLLWRQQILDSIQLSPFWLSQTYHANRDQDTYSGSSGAGSGSVFLRPSVCLCIGVRTGRCVQSDVDPTLKACEIIAWCPVERDQLPLYDVYCCYLKPWFHVKIKLF